MDTQGRIERPFHGFAGRAITNLALCDIGSPTPNRTAVIRFRAGRFATKLWGIILVRVAGHDPAASRFRSEHSSD
jgi:hypothetical protein